MKKYLILIAAAIIGLSACDIIQEDRFNVQNSSVLPGSSAAEMVENDPSFLLSYVNGMYSYMVQYNTQASSSTTHDDYGFLSVCHNLELGGQTLAIGGTLNWGRYDIPHGYGSQNYAHTFHYWNFFYTLIAKANEIIDFFGEADPSNASLRGYLGQAYAIRAMCYTYLVQIYQDPVSGTTPDMVLETKRPACPIIYATRDGKTTDEAGAKGGRNTVADIMEEIERNIALAEPLLKDYTRSSKNEINYSVLKGIEARYYLFAQKWSDAADAAAEAQNGFTVIPLAKVATNGFMEVEDAEVLWGFNHSTETMTSYASFFSHVGNDSSGYGGVGQSVHCIDKALYDQIPDTDARKKQFNGPAGDPSAATTGAKLAYANRKFGHMANWLQDYLYMRVEEMILIEAEAEARQNNNGVAASVLVKLMAQRDPSWGASTVTIDDILLQRKIELWCEGFEYFDIRRNGLGIDRKYAGSNHIAANQFTFPAHDLSWNFQIPLREIQNNNNISEDEQNDYVDPSE
ncbi:MAG: RagB/SusD family nutrient uptake outer membrane protein [Bacteroidales bacterium]|nr:RagB/SusD family nutrient uptake outer membrane protein [Candidatus Cryptobacteroides equifaecalis]